VNIIGLTRFLTITILFLVLFISGTAVLESDAAKFGGIKPIPRKPGKSLTTGDLAPRIPKHSSGTEIQVKVDAAKPLYNLRSFPDIASYIGKNTQEFYNHLFNSLNAHILGFCLIQSYK
jgi:hypothetical protein